MTDAEKLWKELGGDKASTQGMKPKSAGEDRSQESSAQAGAGREAQGQGEALAIAFAVIGHYEWERDQIAWTLCVWRWRWPILVTKRGEPRGYGWVRGIGWM